MDEEKTTAPSGRKKRYTVDVLIGNIHTDHPKRLLRQLYESFRDQDVDVRFFVGTESASYTRDIAARETDYDYQYATLYDYCHFDQADLLIIAYGTMHIYQKKGDFQAFLRRFPNVPKIILEATLTPDQGIYLIADNYSGMKENVNHLIEEHHAKRIAFLSGPADNTDANERKQAYFDAMEEHGLSVDDDMVVYADYSEHVDRQVEELLSLNEDVDAIVSANDEMTVAIYRVLRRHGLEPGQDVLVTGFDDMELAEFVDPPLTTVHQETNLMGKMAAEKALSILHGETVSSERVPTRFVRRSSCGCRYTRSAEKAASVSLHDSGIDLVDAVDSLREFQRMSWTGPLLIRELMSEAENTYNFFMKTGEEMYQLGTKSSYIFLLREPVKVRRNGKWNAPREMYLAMRQKGRNREAYDFFSAQTVGWGEMTQFFHNRRHAHAYTVFLLFDARKQYGIFVAEIAPKDIPFYYTVALQLGTALRFFEMAMQQRAYQNELKAKNESLHFSANHDHMTGLLNRQGFLDAMRDYAVQNQGSRTAFYIADLDHLKEINDTFGHSDGDWAIKNAAAALMEAAGFRFPVGRAGGDEFFGLIDLTSAAGEDFQDRLTDVLERINDQSKKPFYLKISVGLCEFSADTDFDFVTIYKEADSALYEQKKHRLPSVKK